MTNVYIAARSDHQVLEESSFRFLHGSGTSFGRSLYRRLSKRPRSGRSTLKSSWTALVGWTGSVLTDLLCSAGIQIQWNRSEGPLRQHNRASYLKGKTPAKLSSLKRADDTDPDGSAVRQATLLPLQVTCRFYGVCAARAVSKYPGLGTGIAACYSAAGEGKIRAIRPGGERRRLVEYAVLRRRDAA